MPTGRFYFATVAQMGSIRVSEGPAYSNYSEDNSLISFALFSVVELLCEKGDGVLVEVHRAVTVVLSEC
jgi:hypothetical protein